MAGTLKPVYLDVCALCRPFDDQARMRVRLETDAVQLILSHVRSGNLVLIVSPVHDLEIGATADFAEREHLQALLREVGRRPAFDLAATRQRAEQLARSGLGPADAAHVAFAESTGATFITCDDRLLRQCQRLLPGIDAGTPIAYCDREGLR